MGIFRALRLLRILLFPLAGFVVLGGLAARQWTELHDMREIAAKFLAESRVVTLTSIGTKEMNGRERPAFSYRENGMTRELGSFYAVRLPPDGRARIGPDPRPPAPDRSWTSDGAEIAIPMNGPDTVDVVFEGLYGHSAKDDVTKATVVSVGAVVAGVAGFFLQRIILRSLNRGIRPY